VRHDTDGLIIVTLGPSSLTEDVLHRLSRRPIAYVRINLSHTPTESLEETVAFVRRHCSVPLMLDTEGSQVRTGVLCEPLSLTHNQRVRVTRDGAAAPGELPLRPDVVLERLVEGDLLAVDFDSAVLRVDDIAAAGAGCVLCTVLSGGTAQSNKAVTVAERDLGLPPLSAKDIFAVEFAARNGVGDFCLSFTDREDDVRELRALHPNPFVVAKIETRLGLKNLDGIMREADGILIDRGDLSREVPVERLPFAQKHIIARANAAEVPVVVATNFLDTMMEHRAPSRAETNDIVNTLLDGANGLVLAAETAIGRHPVETVSFLAALIQEVKQTQQGLLTISSEKDDVLHRIHEANYITSPTVGCGLVQPHGGLLVDQRWDASPPSGGPSLEVTEEQAMDAEQIALGTYSPLRGFMNEEELDSVAGEMRLPGGCLWPLPVLLRVDQPVAGGRTIVLERKGQPFGVLEVTSSYERDWNEVAARVYGTADPRHPGVKAFISAPRFALAGPVWLTSRVSRAGKRYELTPAQCRRLFEARGWSLVVGFHTRNAPHRAHEHIMAEAIVRAHGDGLLIHPAVGLKKRGDFSTSGIIAGFEGLLESSELAGRAVFGTFPTYSRYGGPREALFTALCRQNYGCSHFVVGRDHTGVHDFYAPDASQKIFAEFSEVGIQPVLFGEVRYSKSRGVYGSDVPTEDAASISGTDARAMLRRGEAPPDWYMRPEVARRLLELEDDLFVGE
jgi:pyruvate kinase